MSDYFGIMHSMVNDDTGSSTSDALTNAAYRNALQLESKPQQEYVAKALRAANTTEKQEELLRYTENALEAQKNRKNNA